MDLILITPPSLLEGELPFLIRLFQSGLETLHLRKPENRIESVRKYLDEIPMEFHDRIMIHDHFELVSEYNLKGIHFTEKRKIDFPAWKDFRGLKSWAVHDEDELLNLPKEVDYALLSPVFPSISKPGYTGKLNMDYAVGYLKSERITAKVYALGGVDIDKFSELKSMSFDGAALLGALWDQLKISPEKAYSRWEEIQEVCQER